MTKTMRLNDLQLVLLSSAAARDNGSLIPLPETCTQDRARIGKAVAGLLRHGLIEELPVTDRSLTWREQERDLIGLFITGAGRAAIGSGPDACASDDIFEANAYGDESGSVEGQTVVDASTHTAITTDAVSQPIVAEQAASPTSSAARTGSKITTVVALLERQQGATLDEMVEATGWLPHTTRAALTGLRKKGRTIVRTKRGDVTCYRTDAEVGR
ncbi:MAG: DUF3489 domain-containing protein [Novosphingobium sp.]|nr:DUF3489 domain-containing protein [Novosphingobium sp.]